MGQAILGTMAARLSSWSNDPKKPPRREHPRPYHQAIKVRDKTLPQSLTLIAGRLPESEPPE